MVLVHMTGEDPPVNLTLNLEFRIAVTTETILVFVYIVIDQSESVKVIRLQLVTGRLADRYDQRKLIIIGSIISFTIVCFISHSPNVTVFALLIIVRSLGSAISLPSSSAITVLLGRRFGMGSVISLLGLATSIGMGLGPIIAGLIYDYLGGISSVFYYAGGMGIISLLPFAMLYRKDQLQADNVTQERASSESTE